jgi:hypothetical protein
LTHWKEKEEGIKMKLNKLLALGVTLSSVATLVLPATTAFADDVVVNDADTQKTHIQFTAPTDPIDPGDPEDPNSTHGNLALLKTPSFDFGNNDISKVTNGITYTANGIADTEKTKANFKDSDAKITAVDWRGGDTGFKIEANATPLTDGTLNYDKKTNVVSVTAGLHSLPTTSLVMNVSANENDAAITGLTSVNINGKKGIIATGSKDMIGEHTSGSVDLKLTISSNQGIKTADYYGTIEYSITDGIATTPQP